jgi:hypothetical protein
MEVELTHGISFESSWFQSGYDASYLWTFSCKNRIYSMTLEIEFIQTLVTLTPQSPQHDIPLLQTKTTAYTLMK